MKRLSILGSVTIPLFLACSAIKPPDSLLELERLRAEGRSDLAQAAAPGAWEEGERHLAMARDAVDRGDRKNAERLAQLGMIKTKTAFAAADQAAARARFDEATERKRVVTEKLEKMRFAVERLEAAEERARIRKHLERVVDATRRRAAAAEELRESALSGEDRRDVSNARKVVGGEMIARAMVWREILGVYAASSELDEKRLLPIDGEIELAKEQLDPVDLAGVQQHVESVGIEARRILDEQWEGKYGQKDKDTNAVAMRLKSKSFEVVEEEFGPAVILSIPASKHAKKSRRWAESIRKLGREIVGMEKLHVVIVSAVKTSTRPKQAEQSSRGRADMVGEELVKSGLEKARVHTRGSGHAAPLVALRKEDVSVAVLLILLP